MTQEFRHLSVKHTNHEDKLQVTKILSTFSPSGTLQLWLHSVATGQWNRMNFYQHAGPSAGGAQSKLRGLVTSFLGHSPDPWVYRGCRDGAVVRALASHQFGPVRFPDPASYLGWVCWFSALHRKVFSGYSGFLSPQKPAFDLICVDSWFQVAPGVSNWCSSARMIRHLSKVPLLEYNKLMQWINEEERLLLFRSKTLSIMPWKTHWPRLNITNKRKRWPLKDR